jgi:xanthine dehydrogenase accessory factor
MVEVMEDMESARNTYQELRNFVEAGQPVAVATVVRVKGAVPREVGAKMIIHPQGRHVGTVGGGCGEAEVIRAALDVIRTGEPQMVRVDLTEEISMQSLGVCGGIMDVFVERWPRHELSAAGPAMGDPLLNKLLESLDENHSVALVTIVSATGALRDALGQHALVWLDREPEGTLPLGDLERPMLQDAQVALDERRSQLLARKNEEGDMVEVFVEVQKRPPTLLIVGAGHIAQPLTILGKLIGFDVAVLDDRGAFANRERFPRADHVIVAPFRRALRDFPIDADTYIVLVTRGHQHDVESLLEVLDSPARYIGMIGSRRRIKAVFQLLEEEQGIPRQKFERVYAPIGLDIGAETPAEIAISIIAEIIKVSRGGSGLSSKHEKPRP